MRVVVRVQDPSTTGLAMAGRSDHPPRSTSATRARSWMSIRGPRSEASGSIAARQGIPSVRVPAGCGARRSPVLFRNDYPTW